MSHRPWALLLMVTALSFAPLLAAGFVWDDKPLVVDNLVTGSLANATEFFQVDLWRTAGGVESDSGYYRPLVLLSFALDRALWGLSPAGHHLHNVAWHLLGVGLLHRLLLERVSPQAAVIGAGLFALHPAQVEAVAWVAARNDLMVAALSFGAVLALVRERVALGGLLALAALLSKESGLFAVGLLLAVQPRPSARQLGALGAAALCWLALRNGVADVGGASVPEGPHLDFLLRRLPQVFSHYGSLLLLGFPLGVGATLEYLEEPLSRILLMAVAWAGLVAWLVRRGGARAALALGFSLLSLAPAVLAIGVRGQLGDRYLYLPLAGLGLALAYALPAVRLTKGLAVAVGLVWVAVIQARLPDWTDDLSLFTSAVETTPNGYSYANLGHELNIRSEGTEACGWFREALLDEPPYVDVCANAVRCALKRGDLEQAALAAELTEARCPRTPYQAGLEGLTWLQRCDVERARRVAAGQPYQGDPRLPLVLAVLARRDGDLEAYGTIEASVPDPASFSAQVDQLQGLCP